MPCSSCGGARKVETWIYAPADGSPKVEVSSQAEANMLVTKNGGGQVYRKP